MKTNRNRIFVVLSTTGLMCSSSHAALAWNNIAFSSTDGTVQNTDITNDAVWGDPSAAGFSTASADVVTGASRITGSFVTNPVNVNQFFGGGYSALSDVWDAGVDGTINFSFTVNGGGTANMQMSSFYGTSFDNSASGVDWYRMALITSGNVTSIDYTLNFNQAYRGLDADSASDAVALGIRASSANASTLSMTVADNTLTGQDAGSIVWSSVSSTDPTIGDYTFSTPTGTVADLASLDIGGAIDPDVGLGFKALDNDAVIDDLIGQFSGSLTPDGTASLASGTVFAMTLNGRFDQTAGVGVIPEPTNALLLSTALSLTFFRRRRSRR